MSPLPPGTESSPVASVGSVDALLDAEVAQRLCDCSPLGILLTDVEGHCIYSNTACQKITGLTLNESLGKHWSTPVHPDDRERASAAWPEAIRQRQPFQTDVRIQRPDASIVWARLHTATIQGADTSRAYLLMIEDISEQKAAESVLRAAEEALFREKEHAQVTLDSIGDAVLVTNLPGNVTYLNREAESLTGWSSDEALG